MKGSNMSIGLLFWILFVIGVGFSGYRGRDRFGSWFFDSLWIVVLIFLLGWRCFGFVIQNN
jgi:hypothetical protein